VVLTGPLTATVEPVPENPVAARLQLRAELARGRQLFLEHSPGALVVQAAGWELKRFSHTGFLHGTARPVRLTRVTEIEPLDPPPERVMDVGSMEAPDPSGTAVSQEEIVGVEQMPDVFVVRFDDGTVWLVWADEWGGVGEWLSTLLLRVRLRIAAWRAADPAPHWSMQTDPRSARHLYWMLQKDLQVIQ
jgi:hypothetical protein